VVFLKNKINSVKKKTKTENTYENREYMASFIKVFIFIFWFGFGLCKQKTIFIKLAI